MPTKVHVIANQKGGVGKTTIAMNLSAVAYDVLVMPDPIMMAAAHAVGDPDSPVVLASTDPQPSAQVWADLIEARGGLPFDFTQIRDPRDLPKLRHLGKDHVFIDTPGSIEDERRLRAALEICDDVLVPITTSSISFAPTELTIEKILIPLDIPFHVVINNWDPRDGEIDLIGTAEFVHRKGWPLCNTYIRRYKIHERAVGEGIVVTQYPRNRTAMEAREDFYRLALELGYGGSKALATVREGV